MTNKLNTITLTITVKTSLPLELFNDIETLKSNLIESLGLVNTGYFESCDVEINTTDGSEDE